MALANVKRGKRKPKNRANKVHLVFDETKRREFLTGFRKRKLQRKKEAQEKLANDLKEERKRLKAEAKESYKKLIVSHRDIPELENLLSKEYEEDDVTVKVVELSANDIAKQNNWIGANQPKYDLGEENDNEEEEEGEPEEIPGMGLKQKPPKVKKKEKSNTEKFDSEKQIKQKLKKQATKNVQKSKVFQKKNKVEQQKQRKQAFKQKKQKDAIKQKFGKSKKRGKTSKKHNIKHSA